MQLELIYDVDKIGLNTVYASEIIMLKERIGLNMSDGLTMDFHQLKEVLLEGLKLCEFYRYSSSAIAAEIKNGELYAGKEKDRND